MDLRKLQGNNLINRKKTRTQDYLPDIDIKNGVIIADGKYIKILEITPLNFRMKSPEEQSTIIGKYASWLRIAPDNFSIKCVPKKVSIAEYTAAFEKRYEQETSETRKELIQDHIRFARNESHLSAIEHHFYLIFDYAVKSDFLRPKSEDEIIMELNNQSKSLASQFATIGNGIVKNEDEDFFLADFLYNYYNKRLTTVEPFMARVKRMEEDYQKLDEITNNRAPQMLDMRDILAPRSVDATHPNYMIIDGLYYMFIAISANDYPSTISPTGWLSALINAQWGVDVDIFYRKQNATEMLTKLKTRTRMTNLTSADISENQNDYEEVMNKKMALRSLRAALMQEQEDIYYTYTFVTLYAYSLEELYRNREALENFARVNEMKFTDFRNLQDNVFLSLAPYNALDARIAKMTYHNVTSSAVAASYPFTSFALQDEGGILLGINEENNSLVIYNNFDETKYPNKNITIFGESGRGKTFALLTITTRFSLLGVQNFIIAPDKQDEFRRICKQLDGVFVDVSPGSKAVINPLDIFPIESLNDAAIYGKQMDETSWVSGKIDSMEIWAKYLYPEMTPKESALFKNAVRRAYTKKGITDDNATIFRDETRTEKVEMPTLSDLFAELLSDEEISEDLPYIFSQFVRGGAYGNMDGQTNIDLTKNYIVFGTENLKGSIQAATMFIILEYIWSVARSDKTKKKIIALDEGWKLLDAKNEQVGDFVVEIFKIIRGYGGAAIFATQNISDTYRASESFGDAILACSHSNILLGTKKKEHDKIGELLDISYNEIADLMKKESGHAILCAGQNHVNIDIRLSAMEEELFATGQKALQKIAEKNKEVMQNKK